jgi:chaperonin GroES
LVKIKSGEDKTTGGLYLPTTAQKKSQEGEVVATGDGTTIGGTKIDPSVKVGKSNILIHVCIMYLCRANNPDLFSYVLWKWQEGYQVVYSKYAGTELEFNGTNNLLLKEDDIIGILETDDIKDLKPLGDRILIKVSI